MTAPFPLIFLSNSFTALEVNLLTNPVKLPLTKGICQSYCDVVATFVPAFSPKLAKGEPKDPPIWIISHIWVLLTFISRDISLAKTFLFFVVCLVFRNNLCGNSSYAKFFLFNLNVAPVLFFAADFNLFNCVFFSLTLSLLDSLPSFMILLHFLEKILIFFL